MNILRSLGRSLASLVDPASVQHPNAKMPLFRQGKVPEVQKLHRFVDGFERLPQKSGAPVREGGWSPNVAGLRLATSGGAARFADGFTAAPRKPLDLSGGVKAPAPHIADAKPAANGSSNGFLASLDDLVA